MIVYIKPSVARGEIAAPPSKSVAHRALIAAALSSGSTVDNILLSDDIKATINGLSALGADVGVFNNSVTLGGFSALTASDVHINANESGSTLRFLIPIAMLCNREITFSGANRLFSRDLSVYEKIAKEQGIKFFKTQGSLIVKGNLKSGEYCVRGDISSQFISGLMFALPLLKGDSVIRFTTPLQSKPYVNITIDVLSRFGIDIKPEQNGYFISGNRQYHNCDITVEGDYSNAAFLDAFNLLGGDVSVKGLSVDTAQGDSIYKTFFSLIKQGGTFDLSDCPDLAPVMFALASEFSGAHFTGTSRLKIKESDRSAAMEAELRKFGAKLLITNNEVIVEKSVLHTPDVSLDSHNDHRIVMALSILASRYGGIITNAEAVNKSYPGFFDDIKKLGIEVEIK